MARPYVPDTGDIVWICFSPQAGHESAGHRPAVGLSPAAYNAQTSLVDSCPMTTQSRVIRSRLLLLVKVAVRFLPTSQEPRLA